MGVCMTKGNLWERGGMHGELGMHGKGGHVWQRGSCMAKRGGGGRWHAWQKGGTSVAGDAATAAGGTYPTGMHSCCLYAIIRGRSRIPRSKGTKP